MMRFRRSYRRPHKSRFVEMFGDEKSRMRLDEVVSQVKVAFVGSCDKFYTDSTSGVPMVRTTNLTPEGFSCEGLKYVTREFHEKNKKSQLHYGDVLVARHGENGRACLYEGGEANCLNVIIVVPNQNMALPLYIECALNSTIVREQIQHDLVGSTQHVLNTKGLAKVKLPIPPLALQREFAAFVAKVDKLAFAVRESLESVEKLYRQQLSEAFA